MLNKMKKVLLTGMTRVQCGEQVKMNYMSAPIAFKIMLEQLGYEVIQKHYDPKEKDDNVYSFILCGLSAWHSVSAVYGYNVLLLSQKYNYDNILYFVDDWAVHKLKVQPSVTNNIFSDFKLKVNKLKDLSIKDEDCILKSLCRFKDKPYNLLAPMFNWGEHNILTKNLPHVNLLPIDPSAFIKLSQVNVNKKNKIWVCASLYDNQKYIDKLDLQWPVVNFHSKQRIGELDLLDVYAKDYGIISPKYGHAGSGWWRMRFLHAIHIKSILLAHKKEVEKLGDAYVFDVHEIEKYSPKQLSELVNEQKRSFEKYNESKDTTLDKLRGHINKCIY